MKVANCIIVDINVYNENIIAIDGKKCAEQSK